MKKTLTTLVSCIFFLLIFSFGLHAAVPIQLPPPQTEGGKPLMQALKERKTVRTFSDEKLPLQTLSNLPRAAFGINRPDGRRTAPSAKNWQEIDIFVATSEGMFRWDAGKNLLDPIVSKDAQAMTGTQAYVQGAAVNLLYVMAND